MQDFKNKKPYRLRLFIHYSTIGYGFELSNSFLFSFTVEYESALLQTNSIEHQTLLIMPFSEPNDTCTCRLLRLIFIIFPFISFSGPATNSIMLPTFTAEDISIMPLFFFIQSINSRSVPRRAYSPSP